VFLRPDDLTMHVRLDGPPGAPALVMLHSLGTDLNVWEPQANALSSRFRVIRPDLRGHGLTGVTPGPYTIAGMARDVLALMDALGVKQAAVAGLSIGGMIAQSLAAQAPDRVSTLILCDTALAIPPASSWHDRAAIVRLGGTDTLEDAIVSRWVTPAFLQTPEAQGLRAMLRRTSWEGYAAAAEAIAAADLTAETKTLRAPTLVLVGEHDASTPVSSAEALRDAIPGAHLHVIPGTAHIPTIERPEAVTEAIRHFLTEHQESIGRYEIAEIRT
jgi:3-oxoadipate enol-lactonase